jgi:tRNA dimethylallyltransferase
VAGLTGRPFSSFAEAWGRYPSGRVRAVGVRLAPEDLRARIESRVARQFEEGFVEEVRDLLDRGLGSVLTAWQAIGYLEVAEHLAGRLSVEEARARIVRRTRAMARRQLAWFRRDPRIRWFEAGPAGAVGIVDELEEHLRG